MDMKTLHKGRLHSKQSLILVFVFILTGFFQLGLKQPDSLQSSTVPAFLWSSYVQSDTKQIYRTEQREWTWQADQIIIRKNDSRLCLLLPGSKTYIQPLAPKLPFISVSIPIQSDESVVFIKTVRLKWKRLPIPTNQLDTHPDLMTISGEQRSSLSFGINLTRCFPMESFSYTVVSNNNHTECYLKLFPIHIWNNQVWLIEQLGVQIGLSVSQSPPIPVKSALHSVIISPDELMEEADQLGRQHQKNGFQSLVIPLSHIQKWNKPADPITIDNAVTYREASESDTVQIPDFDYNTADKIRAFLIHLLKQKQVDYLTLLGDATYIPPSDYIVSLYNTDPYDRMIPTDLFYMAPEANGHEIPLKVITGRIPVRSKEEAISYIRKTILFQLFGNQEWAKSVALFGGDMFDDDYYGELQTSFMVNNGDFGDFTVKKYYETENRYNRESILKAMSEEEAGFFLMSSHGRGDYLRLPKGYVDAVDVMRLTSKNHCPIWLSDSCLNGAWDTRLSKIRYGTGPQVGIPTSFAESLLFSNGGAVAYIGGSRVNYAGMDYASDLGEMKVYQLYYMDAMIQYFFQHYTPQSKTLGEIFAKSVQQYIQYDFDNGYEPTIKSLFGYCLLGDPTIPVPTKNKAEIPEILLKKKPPTQTGPVHEGAPFLDIHQENQFEFTSLSDNLTAILCDYSHPEQGCKKDRIDPDMVQNQNIFSYTLPTIQKTRFAVRIVNEQGYEIRYVASSKFDQDLSLQLPSLYRHLQQGETYQFSLLLKNSGLSSVTDIRIEQTFSSQTKSIFTLPNLDPHMTYPIPVTIDTADSGAYYYQFTCSSSTSADSDDTDNTIEVLFEISEAPYYRIGVIGYDWLGMKENLDDTLSLTKVNQYYQNLELPAEIKTLTEEEMKSIDTQAISAILLYNTEYFPNKNIIQQLKKYTNHDGVVLVMGIFDSQIKAWLGYKSSNDFSYHMGDSSFQAFTMMRSKKEDFLSDTYNLPCFESYSVNGEDLSGVLGENTYIIGYSEDKMLYLIQTNHWITYSGLLSNLDFNRSNESLSFFADLMMYCSRQNKK